MGLTRPRFSQFDTTISSISDPITVLNKSSTLANVDVGFIINRNGGALANTAIFWNEGANTFALAFTTNSGELPNANITISEYANLRVSTLTATFVNTTGNIVSGGNVTAPYFFGNGSQLSGVITSVIKIINGTSDITAYSGGNVAVTVGGTANTVVFTSSNLYVAGSILPSANVTYDLGSPTLRWRTGYFSANTIDIGGGTIGLHDTLGFTFTTPGGNPQFMMPNGASTSNTFTSSTVTIQGNLAVNGNITTIGNIFTGGNASASYFTGSGTALTGINSFGNVFISGQSPVLADNTSDTLTLVGGTGISITANASLDTITIATVSTEGPFAASGDFGAVNDPVTVSEDEGSVADGATITYDLGSIISATGLMYPDQLVLPSYSVSTLPSATVAAQLVYNTTANGLAFSDGTNWSNITASYSNVQVTTYLPTHTGNVNAAYYFGNGSQLTGIVVGSSYSNVQVATYLPTYTGTVGAGGVELTNGNLNIYNNDGNIYIGDITTGTTNTDVGVLFDGRQSIKSALFTEVNGNILSYAINMAQITSNISAIAGGMFRLDVRDSSKKFVVVRRAAGATAEEETFDILLDNGLGRFTSNLQVGRTATNYSNLTVAHSTPSTSTTTGALIVTGGVGIGGNLFVGGTLTESSSATLKENIMPIDGALDLILQLNGVIYDRKDGSRKNEAGLIAEEVNKILPNLISIDDHGAPMGVQYTKLTAYLIEAVKSLKAEIDQLKKRD